MKLAVSSYSLARWRRENGKTLQDAVAWVAQSGVGAIEFSGFGDSVYKDVTDPVEHARWVRQECEALKLAIAGYSVPAELIKPEREQRAVVEELKRQVDAAAALGVKTMRHDVTRGFPEGYKGKKTFGEALKIVVPAIREVAAHAEKCGVVTSLENHGFFMQDPRRVVKLIETVDRANFRLTMDMGNFLCVNADPVAAVKLCVKYAVMAHAKDFHVRAKKTMPASGWFATPTNIALRGAIVGHGMIDVPRQLRILKSAGYDGYLSLEFEGMEEPTKAITLGVEYLRKELEAIGRWGEGEKSFNTEGTEGTEDTEKTFEI